MGKKAYAAGIAAALTALLVTVLRIVLTPQMQDAHTGEFKLSWVIIGITAAAAAAVIVLSYADRSTVLPLWDGRPLRLLSCVMLVFGAVQIITVLYDLFTWLRTGVSAQPLVQGAVALDRLALWGIFLFGAFSGVFAVRFGWQCLASGCFIPGKYRYMPLCLPLWLWMRLARYVVSYASAVSVTETFYDYAMLITSLLFAMSLARYVSGQSNYRSPALLWQALLTVICGVSGTVTRFVMYLAGETEAYQASCMATFPDFCLAVLAGCVALALLLGKEPAGIAAYGEAEEEVSSSEAQRVLDELVPDASPVDPDDRSHDE